MSRNLKVDISSVFCIFLFMKKFIENQFLYIKSNYFFQVFWIMVNLQANQRKQLQNPLIAWLLICWHAVVWRIESAWLHQGLAFYTSNFGKYYVWDNNGPIWIIMVSLRATLRAPIFFRIWCNYILIYNQSWSKKSN